MLPLLPDEQYVRVLHRCYYPPLHRDKLRALLAQEELVEQSMAALEKAASGDGLKNSQSQAQVRAVDFVCRKQCVLSTRSFPGPSWN